MGRSMTSLRPTRKPVFLWQAGLILLPVLVIAAVAIMAIIQNRAEVEREARQRAEEVARQYSKELEHPWGLFLMRHDWYSQQWSDYLANVAGAWPGNRSPAFVYTNAAQAPADSPQGQLAQWQALFPGLVAEEVLPDSFVLTAEGRLRDGLEFNPAPQPPAWFTRLSAGQRTAWEALQAAASARASVEEIEQRIAQFVSTRPGSEAATNAVFIGQRVRWATLPPQASVAEALHAARQNHEALSEAGLPLSNLAFGEALRYTRAAGPSKALWDTIPDQVLRAPSPLVPPLLDQIEALAPGDAVVAPVLLSSPAVPPAILQTSVQAWRTLWHARLKLYDVADIIRRTGNILGLTATTNFWIEKDQARWFCMLSPAESRTVPAPDGGAVANAAGTQVRFLPKSVAEQALARALESSPTKLPAYLGIAATLEGEPLTLPDRWAPRRGTNSAPVLLAEASGRLSGLGQLRIAPDAPEVEREGLPSRPRFVLRVYLADPAPLFEAYRRQALLLTGLVAAAAFGALVGVFASWRAFQHQLRLNELKSNFVSSVSHELRAPIASVRLMAESLERGKVPETAKQHEYFRFIVQECRRLSSLIENVLDFSRIEQGRKQYDLEPTDLVALTRQTVALMETYAAERGVNLQLQLPDAFNHQLPNYQLPEYQVPADGKALQQALINLIDNALKHSPKGDTVTVGLEARSPKSEVRSPESAMGNQVSEPTTVLHVSRFTFHASPLLLWVEDHGEGIPASEQEKIFERFYRRGSELRRQTQGVGIGLSIVKHIVEAHGGKVLVRSAVGQGSRFTIELPMLPTPAKSETRNPKAE